MSIFADEQYLTDMRNYDLDFISNECIFNHVKDTVAFYRTNINLSEFNKNIMHPIKLPFDAQSYAKQLHEIIKSECISKIANKNTNHIDNFL